MYTIERTERGIPIAMRGDTPNEKRAVRRIEDAIDHADAVNDVISRDTARLIAAVIHEGPRSTLAQFAAGERVDLNLAQDEVDALTGDQCPVHWWLALDGYISAERYSLGAA